MRKVIRVANSLGFGGIEKVFELHGKYFDRQDYELIFVAMNQGGKTGEMLSDMGYRVIILNSAVKIPSFSCFRKLRELFLIERPDVVHTCGSEANFHGILAARVVGVPVIVAEEIGLPNHSRVAQTVFKLLYSFTSRVIAISNAVERYLVDHEADAEKVVRIYNPVEISNDDPQRKSLSGKIIFSTLCRLVPIKNCQILIRLLSELKGLYPEREFEFWFIGDGSDRRPLEELARGLDVADKEVFWGYRQNPDQILRDAHIFVLPSLREGFGIACIEAIQAGVPVVVSNSGGMTEFIRDGENGYLFNPLSFEELKQKIKEMLSLSDNKRHEMALLAKKTVDNLFSPHIYLDELKELYLESK